jgi:hypothetical protein
MDRCDDHTWPLASASERGNSHLSSPKKTEPHTNRTQSLASAPCSPRDRPRRADPQHHAVFDMKHGLGPDPLTLEDSA